MVLRHGAPAQSREIGAASSLVTYGWGMIPVTARVGATEYTTSLWPKDGSYIVPVKAGVRRAEGVDEGDTVTVRLTVLSASGLERRG